jgi:hypothetical protein
VGCKKSRKKVKLRKKEAERKLLNGVMLSCAELLSILIVFEEDRKRIVVTKKIRQGMNTKENLLLL